MTDDMEKPKLMTLEATVAPPPFVPPDFVAPCTADVGVLWWRKLALLPPTSLSYKQLRQNIICNGLCTVKNVFDIYFN